jgi:hypothetical protein
MTRLTILILLALAAPALGGVTYHGATGQTLYVRVQTGPTTFVAAALTEGSSGGVGVYTATDATLYAAGLNVPSTATGYSFTVRSGTPSTTASDPLIGSGNLIWNGAVEDGTLLVRVDHTGNDIASGTLLNSAIAAAPVGATIQVGSGTFDVGTAKVVLKARQRLSGAGMRRTEIQSQRAGTSGTILGLADNVVVEDLYVNANNSGDVAQCVIGNKAEDSSGWLNVLFRRVKMFANADVLQTAKVGNALKSTGNFYDCELIGGYDTVALSFCAAGTEFNFYNCKAYADQALIGAYSNTGLDRCIVTSSTNGTVRWFGGELTAIGGNTQSSCVYCTNGTVELYDVHRFRSATLDLERSGGTLLANSCAHDPTKISGTITKGATGVDWQKLVNPGATNALAATTVNRVTLADALTGYTVPPTAAQNATAVRTELATELARLDVTLSTRLAASGYTAPDNASVTAVKAVTDAINAMLESSGGHNRYKTTALEQAPAGGGGSSLTKQDVADAMKETPAGGASEAGSVQDKLDKTYKAVRTR